MAKPTVTRLFIGSLIAALAGAVLLIVAVSVALANDVFVFDGAQIVDVRASGLALGMLGLGIAGALTIIGAAIGGLVSWIGALLNTSQLESKAWFVGLLLLGIFNMGFLAMIAYIVAGPDGRQTVARNTATASVSA